MIDLRSCNFIVFNIDGNIIKIPIVYMLKGFNCIQRGNIKLKWFVDSHESEMKMSVSQKRDRKRIYELKLLQIWNANKLNILLDKNNVNNFRLKIINEDIYYYI